MDKALRYLGLAARAGRLTVGAEECARSLRERKGRLLVAAADAGDNALRQAMTMTAGGACPLLRTGYTKGQLAQAAGRGSPVALVLIGDEGLAKAFAAAANMDRGEQEERQ